MNIDPVRPNDLVDDVRRRDEAFTRCGATTWLTAAERATLAVLPWRTDRPTEVVDCELATDSHGDHLAFVVAADGGEQWWWLRWSNRSRELAQIDPCSAVQTDPVMDDDCMLPDDHSGPHSFDMV